MEGYDEPFNVDNDDFNVESFINLLPDEGDTEEE